MALERYGLVDEPSPGELDDIVRIAARVCDMPVALVTIVHPDKQVFRARYGFDAPEAPNHVGFCPEVVRSGVALVIPDTAADPRHATNPASEAGVRFYAGVPLIAASGEAFGTLCVIDYVARSIDADGIATLEALARQVIAHFELRSALRRERESSAERRRAEGALAANEAYWRHLFEKLQEGFFVGELVRDADGVARDWRFLELNETLERHAGFDRATTVGRTIRELVPGIERSWVTDYVRVVETGEPANFVRHVGLLGRTYQVHAFKVAPERFAVLFLDVTERERAASRREALLGLVDRLRAVQDIGEIAYAGAEALGQALQVSRVGFGTVDVAGETITVARNWTNGRAASLSGSFRLRDYGSFVDDLAAGRTVVLTDAAADPRTTSDGAALTALHARALVNVPVVEKGSLVAILFVHHDRPRNWSKEELDLVREVAERTRIEMARRYAEDEISAVAASLRQANDTLEQRVEERTRDLRVSERRASVYFNTSPEYLVLVRVEPEGSTIFADANPAAERAFGRERAAMIGLRPHAIFPADSASDIERHARTCVETGVVQVYQAARRYVADTEVFLDIVVAPVERFSEGGGLVLFSARDITEQREIEEQLRQAHKMEAVGQLTGGLAHDFNNLLTGITGSLDLIAMRLAQGRSDGFDRYIAAAQGAAKRAAALTHRLLAFSRRQTLAPKPTDANRLVGEMRDLIERTMGPAIVVAVIVADGVWTTLVDASQLENALLNLCINARDAMPDGGKLTIETANRTLDERAARECGVPPGEYVTLSVGDNGSGMAPEVVKRAFDPFFTTKPIGMGTGLGLSMIFGFARQSGGEVRIRSELRRGTTVDLYLPRYGGQADATDEVTALPAAPRAKPGETVLVVDDEATIRMLVLDVLEDLGYTAIEAADGAAGLRVLQSDEHIDLLVTDVGLPGSMNGRQMAEAGRIGRPGLKVLFITGYAENAALGHGHLAPGMHVLTKPFPMETLANRIKGLIDGA